MKRLPTRVLFTSVLLSALLNIFACKPSNPFAYTPISGAVVIDTHEQEFIFDKPFKPKKMVVKICFEYSDKLTTREISQPPKFPDGTVLKLTASVIDQKGRKYELSQVANSVENYLCISPELTNEWMDISKTNTVFIRLLVYSNRKLNVSKIQWVSYDIWDI